MMGIMICQKTIHSSLEKSDRDKYDKSTVSDVQLKLKACSTI